MTRPSSALAGGSRDEAKNFLVGLANLRDDREGFAWFKKNYPHVLETVHPAQLRTQAMYSEGEAYEFELPDSELIQRYWLLPLRDSLRAIWRAPDARTKQWGVFRIWQD